MSNALINVNRVSATAATRVAIIGDSMSAQNAILGNSVTTMLEQRLNSMGVFCKLYPCNRDGHTYFRANTVAYLGGKTAVQACIAADPHVVILCLGINDSLLAVDGRTLAQIKADATTAINAIKTALPTAKILYVSQVPYDSLNFTPANCKNKGMPMYFHQKDTTGILTNYYSTEILDKSVSATTSANLANWVALDAHIKASTQVDSWCALNLWKVARMGGTGNDGVHLNQGGVTLAAGYVLKGLRYLPQFSGLLSNDFAWWEDPEYTFSQLFTASGDSYLYTGDITSENQNILAGSFLRPNTWHLPTQASLAVADNVTDAGSAIFYWNVTGAAPLKQVKVSVNGGAFFDVPGVLTDALGNASAIVSGSDVAGLISGTNTLRYAVGDTCLAPKTVVYAPYAPPWVAMGLQAAWVAVLPGTTYDTAAYYIDKFKRVRMRGIITGNGSNALFTTLPVGYRPARTVFLTSSGGSAISYVQVNPNGECLISGSINGVTLNDIEFGAL